MTERAVLLFIMLAVRRNAELAKRFWSHEEENFAVPPEDLKLAVTIKISNDAMCMYEAIQMIRRKQG